MLQQVPYGVSENLIQRLASAEFLEFGEIHGVTDEFKKLKDRIESINDVLLDADDKQEQANVRIWIRRLKEVLYRADDFIDNLAIDCMRHKADAAAQGENATKVLNSCSSSNRIAYPIQMAEEIKEIHDTFDDVVEGMLKLNLSPKGLVVKQTNSMWRETDSFVLESDIIGRDESKKEIISLLRQPNVSQNVSVIAIVGIGGLGKTVVAQLVYNDLEVQNFFEKRMWVCVSDNFDVKTIVKNILVSMDNGSDDAKLDGLSLDVLQKKLRESLREKRYFLVLDDIWNESYLKWTQLRSYLMCGAQGSKVLVTTRSEIVAKTMGASTCHSLRGLTEEESWSLLKNIAFEDDIKGVNQNLESIGKEIAKRCKGVPLAVRTLGGLLRWQKEESEWEDVLHGAFWKLCEEQDSIMPVLKLSYQSLSPQLRQCFAYCSLYPKDSVIDKNELIQLWMAQGYLECPAEKQHMEDVGNRFVKIFLMKSFFQDAKESIYGDIVSFKMHDLMHDLAMLVAGRDCCYLDGETKRVVGRSMHVYLESNAIPLLESLAASRLRTLILRCRTYSGKDASRLEAILLGFKCLRALTIPFHFLRNKQVDSIGKKMKHLRYIHFSGPCFSPMISLPKSMGNLICLQTLRFYECEKEFFTEVVTKLVNLRCLHFDKGKCFPNGMPVGLGKLSSLQLISPFFMGDNKKGECSTLNELKDLHYLRGNLTIIGLNRVTDLEQDANLKEKNLLQSLSLYWSDVAYHGDNIDSFQLLENLRPHHNLKQLMVQSYPGVIFPSWLSLLTNIVQISLEAFCNCRSLPPLERLPSLKSLKISNLKELEYIYVEEGFTVMFYPSLESLRLHLCPKFRGWWRLGTDINDIEKSLLPFPRLSQLNILSCPILNCMPTFPTVKELRMGTCDVEPLIATVNTAASVCSSSFTAPLSMLKDLLILDTLNMQALPKGWMQNLTSLEYLLINWSDSETLEELETGFQDDTNCLASLKKIRILQCRNLKALPDWICKISSLQICELYGCHNLASLPEGMTRLTNLKTLEVRACPLLLGECRTETSESSRRIARIPTIILKDSY